MASIVKKRNHYCVVYRYQDEYGKTHQKWESFNTNAEAKKRKKEVEYEQETGELIIPQAKLLSELLEEYVNVYGVNNWALSTYQQRKSLIVHYINPVIGDMKIEDITTRVLDKYYQNLLKMKTVVTANRKEPSYLTTHTVREIHKLLRSAFNQAVKWEIIGRNPCLNATLPKEKHEERDIWDAETLFKAIGLCDDEILKLALNTSFAASLRIGEMLGLTWDCIDISDEAIEKGQAYVFINKELQRVNRDALEKLDAKDVLFKFPACVARTSTALVLKTPKTETSIRKVFLPKTVAVMLQERKREVEELKELFGEEFYDYNLVFCSASGRPIEGQVITRALNDLIKKNNLPKIVFHSIRHSSITYKLKLNGGDMKAVQGDSGHAQMKMITDVYSHIIDEDRRLNADKLEQAFYSGDSVKTPDSIIPENVTVPEKKETDEQTLLRLLSNPDMAALIKNLAANL